MENLAAWLKRLAVVKPTDFERNMLRMFMPGHFALDLNDWLMTTEQPAPVPTGFRGGYPESVAMLAYVEHKSFAGNALHHQRLAADISAAMSVALERRIEIPYEMAGHVAGQHTVTFMPFGSMSDRSITGPLPPDSKMQVAEVLRLINGLPSNHIACIGAAASMLHGAMLLFERDIRSAYTLLIAGVETLSRQYGAPPEEWEAWELHSQWDLFFSAQGLSESQVDALRMRLMTNRQLRLKATFKSYASSRLPSAFWNRPWIEWTYPLHVPHGSWGPAEKLHEGRVRDFLPADRSLIGKALGYSYDLRSSYVHQGTWFGPLELTLNPNAPLDASKPLPFAALRAMLRELILVELAEHSQGGMVPLVPLRRNWVPN